MNQITAFRLYSSDDQNKTKQKSDIIYRDLEQIKSDIEELKKHRQDLDFSYQEELTSPDNPKLIIPDKEIFLLDTVELDTESGDLSMHYKHIAKTIIKKLGVALNNNENECKQLEIHIAQRLILFNPKLQSDFSFYNFFGPSCQEAIKELTESQKTN